MIGIIPCAKCRKLSNIDQSPRNLWHWLCSCLKLLGHLYLLSPGASEIAPTLDLDVNLSKLAQTPPLFSSI